MTRERDALLALVESFFQVYLVRIRGVSKHTIASYRDTLRMFFEYLAAQCNCEISKLKLDYLGVERVIGFLDYLEERRGNSALTRNCRLAALRSFFRHLVHQDPTRAGQYQRVLSLRAKQSASRSIDYLEPREVKVLLAQPDRRKATEIRDYALLLFLYNTGARISEALGLRFNQLCFTSPQQVRLLGKGGKERLTPLWPETTHALRALRERATDPMNGFVFVNRRGEALTRDGAAYAIRKYVARATRIVPGLDKKRITPHVMRHSCAVALLQAGIDQVVVRDYLGHQSIVTTARYAQVSVGMKKQVLMQFWRRSGLDRSTGRKWTPGKGLLAYLASLDMMK